MYIYFVLNLTDIRFNLYSPNAPFIIWLDKYILII